MEWNTKDSDEDKQVQPPSASNSATEDDGCYENDIEKLASRAHTLPFDKEKTSINWVVVPTKHYDFAADVIPLKSKSNH